MPRYEIEQNELCTVKYHVDAANEAEAIAKLFESSDWQPIEWSLERQGMDTDRGLLVGEHPELVQQLCERGIDNLDDVIPGIAGVTLLNPPATRTYEIEQYELHSVQYRVRAASRAKAIQLVLEGKGKAIDESQEFIEVVDRYGLAAELNPNLCAELTALGVEGITDVIPSIREIEELDATDAAPLVEPETGVGAVLEPAGREKYWQVQSGGVLPASRTYRVRYEIDVDAEDPLAAARHAYAFMVSPESYRPVLEVVLHQGTGEVDFSTAETFDLHEVGCRDDMAQQLELVAEIIESTYPHDANGGRVEGDSPISGADVVDRLAALEQPIRDILHRHAPGGKT